ncbi:hypothetical protein F4820DRAFT_469862 [Hypoxylon rubiginosum]|uniref:Uncharacterized protein n=1 Tax=Hypoxylon rubiginosum TaxID=110542 RepID=A0ACB9Z1G6_9PEZI|nr:hypothetical protein F4820DRAFT_469862 [Hypoxylon rubiginosum]
MKATFASPLTALFLPALTTTVSADPSPDYSRQPISASCMTIALKDNHVLSATCLAPSSSGSSAGPSYASSDLELDGCLANYAGDLSWPAGDGGGGGFSSTCDDCYLDGSAGTTLTCECGRGGDEGGTKRSTWDLDDWKYVQNTRGVLTCSYDDKP